MLLFIRHGQIHCRTFFSDSRDADELPTAHYQMWKRIDDLKGTAAEAYAVATLTGGSSPLMADCGAIYVRGAERDDAVESGWFQRISSAPGAEHIEAHECWPSDVGRAPNAISPFQDEKPHNEAEPDAAPNGGPAGPFGSLRGRGGPPSVS